MPKSVRGASHQPYNISEDPIKLLGGFNVFAYVSDSNAWVDIWGLLAGDILTEGLVYRAGGIH